MMNKKQIEAILRVNGIPASSPDDEIRSILLSARYNNDEVDTALIVLRENSITNDTHVDGLHKIFRSNEGLKPDEIYKLLGVEATQTEVIVERRREHQISPFQLTVIWLLSLTLAVFGIFTYMYMTDVGIFHSPSTTLTFHG
ncbi:MAG: hypothetical protein RLZZ230_966 [Candidatus Parcubacteria bacterium]|jgi:hypothetical protein